jgi:O-antigen biosynthesis protein WbqP
MSRFVNFTLAIILLPFLLIPMILISIVIIVSSGYPVIYWSKRVGKDRIIFNMPKFRTMSNNTPEVATHLLNGPDLFLTPIGKFLRKTSLDELPQIWCVISGQMNLVGPRPALHNQFDLIELRVLNGVDKLTPGVTGWAQINGRDDLSIPNKVSLEKVYLQKKSFWFDVKILWKTMLKVVRQDSVSH